MNEETLTYVTLNELAERLKVPKSWLYERSRRNAIPGQRRAGRHIRVDLAAFHAGLEAGDLD